MASYTEYFSGAFWLGLFAIDIIPILAANNPGSAPLARFTNYILCSIFIHLSSLLRQFVSIHKHLIFLGECELNEYYMFESLWNVGPSLMYYSICSLASPRSRYIRLRSSLLLHLSNLSNLRALTQSTPYHQLCTATFGHALDHAHRSELALSVTSDPPSLITQTLCS